MSLQSSSRADEPGFQQRRRAGNSLKIIEVIKHHMEGLVTGKRTAEQTMPEVVREVSGLMPKCGG